MNYQGLSVDFVIPTLNQKKEISKRRMDNLMSMPGDFGVIIVGTSVRVKGKLKHDTTWDGFTEEHWEWGGINPNKDTRDHLWLNYNKPQELSPSAINVRYIKGTRLTIMEVEVGVPVATGGYVDREGRNANVLRNVGCMFSQADVFLMTDGKITHPPTYLNKSLHLLVEKQVDAVAGEVNGLFDDPPHWIDVFGAPGGSIFRRFGRFGRSFVLKASNIKKMMTLPVLATFAITREGYEKMQGWFELANISYEDFMSVQMLVDNGGKIWLCNDDDYRVFHATRKSFKDMKREWDRSGAAAAEMLHYFPNSGFANKRFADVTKVLGTLLFGVAFLLSLIITGHAELLIPFAEIGALMLFGAGVANAYTAKHWYGFFFPIVTGYLLARFSVSFLRQHIFRDGAKRLFQSIWGYLSIVVAVLLLSEILKHIQP